MIRNLKQESFHSFGAVLSAGQKMPQSNQHSITLRPGSRQVYQTAGRIWLSPESGMTVLSVGKEDQAYQDFYLDKPVMLSGQVWFSLTALDDRARVCLAGSLHPRQVRSGPAQDFVIRPRLQVESVCTLFYQEREQGFLFPGESHPMVELTYVDAGSLHCVADGLDVLLGQGDMMLFGPDQWHMQYADIGVAPQFVTVTFTARGAEALDLYGRSFRAPQRAVSILQQILQEQGRGEPGAEDSILSLLTLLLVSLCRETEAGSKPQLSNNANHESQIIRAAQQYIGTHVCQKLSVPQVAQGIRVSASYLTALFHKHLQISPGEYIRRIKLQKSKQMIREGNLNFTQIAQALQYSTVHHFSRQFKEKFGLTPTQYARSVR